MRSFGLGAEPNMPDQFRCVATEDPLILAAMVTAKNSEIIENILTALIS
jgi:hypothetical protein